MLLGHCLDNQEQTCKIWGEKTLSAPSDFTFYVVIASFMIGTEKALVPTHFICDNLWFKVREHNSVSVSLKNIVISSKIHRRLSFSKGVGAVRHLQPMRSCYRRLHKGFRPISHCFSSFPISRFKAQPENRGN